MKKWIKVSNKYRCYISSCYKMNKATLDEKELTFKLKTEDNS